MSRDSAGAGDDLFAATREAAHEDSAADGEGRGGDEDGGGGGKAGWFSSALVSTQVTSIPSVYERDQMCSYQGLAFS